MNEFKSELYYNRHGGCFDDLDYYVTDSIDYVSRLLDLRVIDSGRELDFWETSFRICKL